MQKEPKHQPPPGRSDLSQNKITFNLPTSEKYVGLHSFGSNSNISDPVLDSLRHKCQMQRFSSPTKVQGKIFSSSTQFRNRECGKGLNEILTIPEAYLNKQISSESLRNFMVSGKCYVGPDQLPQIGKYIFCFSNFILQVINHNNKVYE